MLLCGECRNTFQNKEEREQHRTHDHVNSPGFCPGGFCAFCKHHSETLFEGYDHLVEAHANHWETMAKRVELTYGYELHYIECQYTIAKAALSRRPLNPPGKQSIAAVLSRIDTLAEKFEDDVDDQQPQQLHCTPTTGPSHPPDPTDESHYMPILTAMLDDVNDQQASGAQKCDEVSRKRGSAETMNGPQEALQQKRPRPIDIPPNEVDEVIILDSPDSDNVRHGTRSIDITTGEIKMEVDYVTAFANLPPPFNLDPSYTEPLHVKPPSTPVFSIPPHCALLTPESSVHTNATQPDDDVIDQKPTVPKATAHIDEGELDERKFMDSDSTVSTSSGSGLCYNVNQGFFIHTNQFPMFVGYAQFQPMFFNQSMALPQMANQYSPVVAALPFSPFMVPAQDSKIEFWDMNEPGQCPICRLYLKGKSQAKKNHFLKHHYTIYFMKIKVSQLQKFLGMRLGAERGDRICQWCDKGSVFVTERHGMIGHLQQCHPLAFSQFCCEYVNHWSKVASESSQVTPPDDLIHNIAMSESARCAAAAAAVSH